MVQEREFHCIGPGKKKKGGINSGCNKLLKTIGGQRVWFCKACQNKIAKTRISKGEMPYKVHTD